MAITIHEKINNVRIAINNLNLKKTGVNKFANYKYYELADFEPFLVKLTAEQKLAYYFNIIKRDSVDVAILNVVDYESKDEVEFESIAPLEKETMQSVGARITYMRRYLLMMAFSIVENDLVDARTDADKYKASDRQKEELMEYYTDEEIKKMSDNKGYASLDQWLVEEVVFAISHAKKNGRPKIGQLNKGIETF